jgi:Arc/MetJ-type ribon-helix-helix transcriptional regulator
MAKKSKPSRPLTIDLPTSLIEKIELCRRGSGFASNSEVVRAAISEFDFATCRPEHEQHRQISVRIAPEQRAALQRYSRQKDVSVGELLRMAIDALTTRKSRRR